MANVSKFFVAWDLTRMGVAATPFSVKLHGWLGMKMPEGLANEQQREAGGGWGAVPCSWAPGSMC